MRGPSFTYASDPNRRSTSRSSNRLVALAMADCSTFSTVGAMRLLTLRSRLKASPACMPRIISTTRRAFCGETRMYLASALTGVLGSMLASLCRRLSRFLRGCLHRMAFKYPGGGELAEFVTHHILGDVHRNELLAVVDRDGIPDELRKNGGAPRPGADHLLLVGGGQHRHLGFEMRIDKRSLRD